MKTYKITVNGFEYEVSVEEVSGGNAAKAASAPVFAKPQAASAAPAASQSAAGSVKITAPMPGKILSVKAAKGDSVKKGDVIMILEAMKMENEIVASQDGTIASINVNEGATVEAGTLLASLN